MLLASDPRYALRVITIKVDISKAVAGLNALQQRQIPYAKALALTRIAQSCQTAVRTHMREVFILRNNNAVQGIKILPAQKSDATPYAAVYVDPRWDYLIRQNRGGLRVAIGGRQFLCIPTNNVRSSPTQIIPQALRPRTLLSSPANRCFIIESRGLHLLMQRTGKGKRDTRVMYVMVPWAKLKALLQLAETSIREARRTFNAQFTAAMAEALRTAR